MSASPSPRCCHIKDGRLTLPAMLPTVMMEPLGDPLATRALETACVRRKVPWEKRRGSKKRRGRAQRERGGAEGNARAPYLQVDLDDPVEVSLLHFQQELVQSDPRSTHTHGRGLEVPTLREESRKSEQKIGKWNVFALSRVSMKPGNLLTWQTGRGIIHTSQVLKDYFHTECTPASRILREPPSSFREH